MTELKNKVVRSLPRKIDRKYWITTIDSVGISFRRKHSKLRYPTVSWEHIWGQAAKLAAEERLELKRKKKYAFATS